MSLTIESLIMWYPTFIDNGTKRGKLICPNKARNLVLFLLIDQKLIHL